MMFSTQSATSEIYTLSLHDALPICGGRAYARQRLSRLSRGFRDRRSDDLLRRILRRSGACHGDERGGGDPDADLGRRSEEHTSELQSLRHLVCRLLLEKKNKYGQMQ